MSEPSLALGFKKTGVEAGSDQLQYDQLELNFRMMVDKNT